MKLLFLLFAAAVIRGVQGPTPPGELLQGIEDVVVGHQLLPRDRVVHLDPGPEYSEARDLSEAVEEQGPDYAPHGGSSELVLGRTLSKAAGAHQEQNPEPELFSDDDSLEEMQPSISPFISRVDVTQCSQQPWAPEPVMEENSLESYCVPGYKAQGIPSQVSLVRSLIGSPSLLRRLDMLCSQLTGFQSPIPIRLGTVNLEKTTVPVQQYLKIWMTDGQPEKVCAVLAALLEFRLASSQCCLHFEFNADNFLQGMTMEVSDDTEWLVIDPDHCIAVDVNFLMTTDSLLQLSVRVKWLPQLFSVDSNLSNQKLQVQCQALSALRCFIGVIDEYQYTLTLHPQRFNELLRQLIDILMLYMHVSQS